MKYQGPSPLHTYAWGRGAFQSLGNPIVGQLGSALSRATIILSSCRGAGSTLVVPEYRI